MQKRRQIIVATICFIAVIIFATMIILVIPVVIVGRREVGTVRASYEIAACTVVITDAWGEQSVLRSRHVHDCFGWVSWLLCSLNGCD